MSINFPLSASVNDTYTYLTKTWKWNGVAWERSAATETGNVEGLTGEIAYYYEKGSNIQGATAFFYAGDKIGIGTSGPTETLDVRGGITASGRLYAAQGITSGGDIHLDGDIIMTDGRYIKVEGDTESIYMNAGGGQFTFGANAIDIGQKLRHSGDVDTYLDFTTDDVTLQAGGNEFLHGTSTYAEFGGVTFAGGGATFAEVTVLGGITASGALYVGQGATFGGNITAPTFVGDLTGDVTGTSSVATVATTVTITDNESTAEDNAIIFAAGGDVDGGNLGLESDGNLIYNPSTGKVTTPIVAAAVQASALLINGNYNLPTGAGATGDVLMIADSGSLEFESLKTTATFIVDSDIPLATGIRYKGLFAVPFSKMDVVDIQLRSHDVSPAGSGDSLSVALKAIRRTSGLEAATPSIQFTVETAAIPLGGEYHISVNESDVDTPGVGADNAGMFLVVDVVSNAGNHTNFTMLVTMEARP